MARPYPKKEAPVYKEVLIWFLIATTLAVVNWLVLNPGGVDDTGIHIHGLILQLIFSYFVFTHILILVAVFRSTLYPRIKNFRSFIQHAAGLLFAFAGFSIGMFNLQWFGDIVFEWLFPGHSFHFSILDTINHWLLVFIVISIIGIFAISYYTMWINLKESYRIHMERERLRSELGNAREMQMKLMPAQAPVVPGIDIAGLCDPAREVGGDFFDYFHTDETPERLAIAVADVSGKGMKAAMTAVMTNGMLHASAVSDHAPDKLLRIINSPLHHKTDKRMFTALLYGVIDTQNGTFEFVNAGQMPPLLMRNKKLISLASNGPRLPLGITPEVPYESTQVELQPGDRLLIHTDGVNEAMNPDRELFGTHRLTEAFTATDQIHSSPGALTHIRSQIDTFTNGHESHDDITMVMITVDQDSLSLFC